MNRLIKILCCLIILVVNSSHLFANIGSRGRMNSGGPSDSSAIIFAIFGIIIGGGLGCLFLFGEKDKNNPNDKEMTKYGCAFIIATAICIILLVGMCSN